jgi:ribonucleoside-diphosphate reductase alpha chain
MEAPLRRKMPKTRNSITHKFVLKSCDKIEHSDGRVEIVDLDGYLIAGMHDDGRLGELFLTIGKEGGKHRVYDCFMIAVSLGLQYGVPLEEFVDKFMFQKFEPAGVTSNPEIPMVDSIPDYVFKWLSKKFPGGYLRVEKKDAGDGSSGCSEEGAERTGR